MRKSKLLTFLFAFIPGCGEMYLGMMRKGVLIMCIFCGCFSLTSLLRMEFFLFLLPVISAGIGRMGRLHAANEYITVEGLNLYEKFAVAFLKELSE